MKFEIGDIVQNSRSKGRLFKILGINSKLFNKQGGHYLVRGFNEDKNSLTNCDQFLRFSEEKSFDIYKPEIKNKHPLTKIFI